MIIKKFQGKTELEATEAAKKELGSNIVTMNVRSVKRKGFLRFFLKDLVEVTVALEEENEKYSPVKKEEKKENIQPSPISRPALNLKKRECGTGREAGQPAYVAGTAAAEAGGGERRRGNCRRAFKRDGPAYETAV